jgi:hypothetical protein
MNLSKSLILGVSKRTLLFEAAVVWMVAGVILLFKGFSLSATSSGLSWFKIAECTVSGLIFFLLLFYFILHKSLQELYDTQAVYVMQLQTLALCTYVVILDTFILRIV